MFVCNTNLHYSVLSYNLVTLMVTNSFESETLCNTQSLKYESIYELWNLTI